MNPQAPSPKAHAIPDMNSNILIGFALIPSLLLIAYSFLDLDISIGNITELVMVINSVLVLGVYEVINSYKPRITWFGVRGVIIVTIFLQFDLFTAALLLFLGGIFIVLGEASKDEQRFLDALERALYPLGMSGFIMVVAILIELLMPTRLPPVAHVFLVGVLSAGATHWLGYQLIDKHLQQPPLWGSTQRRRLLLELILLFLGFVLFAAAGNRLPTVYFMLSVGLLLLVMLYVTEPSAASIAAPPVEPPAPAPPPLHDALHALLNQPLSLRELGAQIAQLISSIAPSQSLFIAVLKEGTSELVLDYLYIQQPNSAPQTHIQTIDAHSLEAQVITQAQVLSVNRAPQSDALALSLAPLLRAEYRCFLGIPILFGGQGIGLIGLLCDEPTDYSTEAQQQLQEIAQHMSLTLKNATLYSQNAQLSETISLMTAATQNLHIDINPSETLGALCQTAMQVVSAQRVALFVLERPTRLMRLRYQQNLTEGHRKLLQAYYFSPESQPLTVHNTHNSRRLSSFVMQQALAGGFRAFTETFLISDGQPIGVLTVYHDQPYSYNLTERDLLGMLATQLVVVLENSELLQMLEGYASEMSQLVHLSRTSIASLIPEEVAENTIDLLKAMFNVDAMSILTIQQIYAGNDVLNLLACEPPTMYNPHRKSLNLLPELAKLNPNEQNRLVISTETPQLSREMHQFLFKNQFQGLILTALHSNHQTLGYVALGMKQPRVFLAHEWQLLETAVNITATQIQNAQLYNTTREALVQRLQQLSYIERLVQQISSALDIDTIIHNIFETTHRVTDADHVFFAQKLSKGYRVMTADYSAKEDAFTVREAPVLSGMLAEVYSTGDVLLSPAYNLPTDVNQTPSLSRYPSVLGVPLLQEGRVMGVLGVESAHRNFFTTEQANYLQSLAGHIAMSLSNAQYLQAYQRQLSVLNHLRQLSIQVTGLQNSALIAQHVVDTAQAILNEPRIGLYQYNARLGALEPLYERPTPPPLPSEAHIAQARTHLSIQQVPHESGFWLLSPIVRGKNVDALLVAYRDAESDENTLDALEMLSHQAASHLENRALYEQLQEASQRTRTILDSTHDGMVLLSLEGEILDYNAAAESILGVPLRVYRHKSADKVHLSISGYSTLGALLKHERQEMQRQFSETETLYIRQTILPVRDTDGGQAAQLLVLRDITEEKELDKHRDEVMLMLVHDLRGPLGSVIAGLRFAQDLLASPEDMTYLPEVLDLAHVSANRLLHLINTLLDVEREQLSLLAETVDIRALIAHTVAELTLTANQVGVTIDFDIDPQTPLIHVDGEKIQRVLLNLLDNAIDYGETQVKITVAALPATQMLEVRVMDDGAGISADQRERIFGKFAQGQGQNKRRTRHTGIGLAFCKRAIEAHGGKIWVADPQTTAYPLKGACFVFTLPYTLPHTEG